MAETEHEAALLADHAASLCALLVSNLPHWVEGVLQSRAPSDTPPEALHQAAAAAMETTNTEVIPSIERLLATDIDQQWSSPLDIVRSLVPALTAQLDKLGARTVPRDAGRVEMYPDDRFALTPATFADIHPELHQPGLAWGAAKAHVHLRRYGNPTPSPPVVVVFAPDLGDRSRFDAYTVNHVRSAGKLVEFAQSSEPDLVIVDLDRTSAPADFRIDNAHVIGFGSHVDTERHDEALDAGFDAVMARSIFFRRLSELLEPVAKAKA